MTIQIDDEILVDLSKDRDMARREMRAALLATDNDKLRDLVYSALMLSEHEARREGVNLAVARANLSNRAEA